MSLLTDVRNLGQAAKHRPEFIDHAEVRATCNRVEDVLNLLGDIISIGVAEGVEGDGYEAERYLTIKCRITHAETPFSTLSAICDG